MAKKTNIDYEKIRIEYINSEVTLSSLAQKYGLTESALESKCWRDGWQEQRKELQAQVLQKANAELADKRAKELVEWNDSDLRVAKALRAKAVKYLLDESITLSPMELRALATTVDSAQKIGRLALGVSTNNTELTGKDGSPLINKVEVIVVD